MAAHRYWRAVGLEAYATAALELSEFHLMSAGVRADAPATLTASAAPDVSGALANLQDDNLTTVAHWSGPIVKTLVLMWDFFGGPVDVGDIRLAGGSELRFLLLCKMQWSDDAVTWTDAFIASGIAWPGVGAKTTSVTATGAWSLTDTLTTTRVDTYEDLAWLPATGAVRGVAGVSSGVVQFEVVIVSLGGSPSRASVGVGTAAMGLSGHPGGGAGGYGYDSTGNKSLAGGAATPYGATYAVGDTIGVVVNFTTGALTFYKNGVSQGVASATGMLGLTLYPCAGPLPSGTAKFFLRGDNFLYPVAGATAGWSLVRNMITKGAVAGRAAPNSRQSAGEGPVTTYGDPALAMPITFGILDGTLKDTFTGVMGKGIGRVRGTVKDTPNTPVHRKVFLIRYRDGMVIRQLWSDPVTGAYDFQYIDEFQSWTVVSYDHTGLYRAVIADNITPELMP